MSRWIVQNVPAWWLVGLAVVVLPALAVLIQWLIRRRAPSLASGENNDAVGFLGRQRLSFMRSLLGSWLSPCGKITSLPVIPSRMRRRASTIRAV